jgi:hypothetical protein
MSRNEIIIEHEGERLNLSQWAKRLGLSQPTLSYRISAGWPLKDALSPERRRRKPANDAPLRDRIEDEFNVLVHSIEHDLRRFRDRIRRRPRNHDRGVGRMKRAERSDQTTRPVKDSG